MDVIEPEFVNLGYAKNYSEEGFWNKIVGVVKSAGLELIYKALQLYYATQSPNCPAGVKAAIYAALGYFILPIDIVPDFIPGMGFADDLAALTAALVMAQAYVDLGVRTKARNTVRRLFGDEAAAGLE
ncbi:MAG: DUF1232 domain-containing protein [Fretibacterium sp.]|nr:DUF1232 domain-containing protein [Fretibacterium sp.]